MIILLLLIFVFADNAHALLQPTGNYYDGNVNVFAINAVHNKIYAGDVYTNNIYVFDLNSDSGILGSAIPRQTVNCTTTAISNIGSMAIDVMKKKLYVGLIYGYGHIYIYNIDDTGLLQSPPTYYSHKAYLQQVNAMYIDLAHNILVTTGTETGDSFHGLVISKLGSDGLPIQSQGDTYGFGYFYGGRPVNMIPDLVRNKLYRGYSQYGVCKGNIVDIDANGYPLTSTSVLNDSGGDYAIAYDPGNNRLYFGTLNFGQYMWRLDDNGSTVSLETIIPSGIGVQTTAIIVDPVRRKYIYGCYSPSRVAYYNLDSDGKISTLIDSGYPGLYVSCIGYEPVYNRVYLSHNSGGGYFKTYESPDSTSKLTAFVINNGETLTEDANVTLKFQYINPSFVYVSGDLLSIGNPIGAVNLWKSCGGGMWKNAGETGVPLTLNVPAVLSSGMAEKTIEVWYSGSTSRGFTSMMRKASAKIYLVERSALMSSVGISRIDYSGARLDYAVVDGRGRNVNVSVQYKTKDKDWIDASEASGSEGKNNLAATITGVNHYFVWDMEKDISENAEEVQVRIKADNSDSPGVWVETAKYSVPNWTGDDLRVLNASIKNADNTYAYRARLEWSGLSDTTTTYEVQKREDDGNWGFISTMTGTNCEVENLSETPVYTYKVRLRTKEGLFSAYSPVVSIKLSKRIFGTKIVGTSGGKVYIEDFDGIEDNNTRVEIDENTFREDAEIVLEKFGGPVYEIRGKKKNGVGLIEVDFRKPVTLKLRYDREEIKEKGWTEDDIVVYYYDGIRWISIGGKVDKTNQIVAARVNHFSSYKIAEKPEKSAISIVPDYFSPNNDGINDVMYFYFATQEMVEKAEIRIYDMTGKIVRVIKADGSNTMYWDGRNETGVLCESGLYVCVIESGTKKITESINLVK